MTDGGRLEGDPSVTIIVTARNYGHFLRECLESCVLQSVWCEIVYSDDASTDDSVSIARAFGDRVRIISCPWHAGAVVARNRGAEAASGDVLVFLDGDDKLPSDFVEQKLAVLGRDNPFAYGSIREFGEGEKSYIAPPWGEVDLKKSNFCETATRDMEMGVRQSRSMA